MRYRRDRGITEPILPVASDYVMSCRHTPAGTSMKEGEAHVAAWPHSAYWRRQYQESQLRPYHPEPANDGATMLQ